MAKELNINVRIPEVVALISHLDKLYTMLLIDKMKGQQQTEEPMVEILGKPYIQTRAWHNPGHSSVTESA